MLLTAYYIFAAVIILVQLPILLEAYRHWIYTRRKYRPKPARYQPLAALICPCKGLDTTFDRNIRSLFAQDYPRYEIFFVVESREDPAYGRLQEILRDQVAGPVRAHIQIAGIAETCAQKVHNQRVVCQTLPPEFEALAFVDSDGCLKPQFLSALIHPLRRRDVGASTGYRWYVPVDRSLSSIFLGAINASVASLLGPHNWNCTWGGAMAVRRTVFDRADIMGYWKNACSDDLPLTRAVKDAGLFVAFAPGCFVPSYDAMGWGELYRFARRQFLITRICMPPLWWLALLSWGHFVLAFWTGVAVTGGLALAHSPQTGYAAILPAFLLAAHMVKATSRQVLIRSILTADRGKLLPSAILDIVFGPVAASVALVFLIASATSRRMVWRGIRYYLHDVNHTEITRLRAPKEAQEKF
ncbi:MAG: glycosyltransferase family 2 protein [Sedimentisphaerales bacterium]|nr:glycosyltransferase family 2 protein [Sedimentisphaerales bacterium]